MTGSVKWFNPQKGYGFICRDDGLGDIMVHYTGIVYDGGNKRRVLLEQQRVEFEVRDTPRGPQAFKVRVIA